MAERLGAEGGSSTLAVTGIGELVWYRHEQRIRLGVYAPPGVRADLGGQTQVVVSNLSLPWVTAAQRNHAVFRHPIRLWREGDKVAGGPVFAVLAGSRRGDPEFYGSRANFRDLLSTARQRAAFMYVLPAASPGPEAVWTGYVRTGYRRWIPLPCPRPEAVYNRIPTRSLERTEPVMAAKQWLRRLQIPMFNPEYFNKAVIYRLIEESGLGAYLPETRRLTSERVLRHLLQRNRSVYLKPAGGSIGHGIIRIDWDSGQCHLTVLKNGRCRTFVSPNFKQGWAVLMRERLPGSYVVQAAKPLLRWQGRPCDFRVLLQKFRDRWHVVGKGVRVAGPGSITTHVPNGGYIMDAATVLKSAFGARAEEVEQELDRMVLECAKAIDAHYLRQLGEMSMDVGLDTDGGLWFLEANSKPMKFDEPDIRERSLAGVIRRLEELRRHPRQI